MASENAVYRRFDDIFQEHRLLQQLLRRIRETVALRNPEADRIAGLMADLENDLRAHFMHEEHGGYLHEALARAPHFAGRASVLVEEHQGFLKTVSEIRDEVSARNWRQVAASFRRFSRSFILHETNENSLVQEAKLRDIEAED